MGQEAGGPEELTAEQYRYLLEHSHDVFTVVEEDGTVRYQSPASAHVKGWSAEEMRGENILEYVHPEDRDRVEARLREMAESVGRFQDEVEFRFRTPDDEWIWLAITGTNPGPEGPVEGFIVSSREMTERKRIERDLRRQNERLEEFASVVSHDLRNPLNVAQGRLELARRECDSEHLDSVQRAHDRMAELIEDVLTLARQGETVGETEPVDVGEIARDCWRSVDGGEAALRVAEDLAVRADRSRLRQLLDNLLRNAIELGGEGVTVSVGALPDGFYVEDDGPGIPPGDREHVFESGFSTAEEGTGFGLAIVRRIAEAHGWSVDVREAETGGARFEVTGVETG